VGNDKDTKLFKIVSVLSLVGIFLAIYLLYGFVVRPEFQPCNISSAINCDAVTKGEVSTFAGIPVPLIGLTGYILLLYFALSKNKKLMFGMSLFGTLFCLRITFIEVFQLKVVCPVCLACQIVMINILLLSVVLMKGNKDLKESL